MASPVSVNSYETMNISMDPVTAGSSYQDSYSPERISNRQQAIINLIYEEISSYNEIQDKFCEQYQLREVTEGSLLLERTGLQNYEIAYKQCYEELLQKSAENERLKAEVLSLKRIIPKPKPSFQLDAAAPKNRQIQILQRRLSKIHESEEHS